jgi:hypothetical protein
MNTLFSRYLFRRNEKNFPFVFYVVNFYRLASKYLNTNLISE